MLAFVGGFFLLGWRNTGTAISGGKGQRFHHVAALSVVLGGRLATSFSIDCTRRSAIRYRCCASGRADVEPRRHYRARRFHLFRAWRHRLSWFSLADNLGVVAPIGLFLGRWPTLSTANWTSDDCPVGDAIPDRNGERAGHRQSGIGRGARRRAINRQRRTIDRAIATQHRRCRMSCTPRSRRDIHRNSTKRSSKALSSSDVSWFLRVKTRQPRGVLAGAFFVICAIVRIFVESSGTGRATHWSARRAARRCPPDCLRHIPYCARIYRRRNSKPRSAKSGVRFASRWLPTRDAAALKVRDNCPQGRQLERRPSGGFPDSRQEVHGKPLIYFDSAATTQKPRAVIAAITRYYERDNANVHRGLHALSTRATEAYKNRGRASLNT